MDIKEYAWTILRERGVNVTRPTFNAIWDTAWALAATTAPLTKTEQYDVVNRIVEATYGVRKRQPGWV